jgi:hypothetical protein
MPRKQTLTNDNILSDVKNILKHPATLSHAEHKKANIPLLAFSTVMLIALVVFQKYYKWILILGLIFIVAYLVVDSFRKKNKINNISIDDYEIKKESVSHINEEIYSTDHKIHFSSTIKKIHTAHVYIVYFENGKSWNIPKDNYMWSGEHPMSDHTIYQSTRACDQFWTVTKKDTGEIVMAYPAEYFEYKISAI